MLLLVGNAHIAGEWKEPVEFSPAAGWKSRDVSEKEWLTSDPTRSGWNPGVAVNL